MVSVCLSCIIQTQLLKVEISGDEFLMTWLCLSISWEWWGAVVSCDWRSLNQQWYLETAPCLVLTCCSTVSISVCVSDWACFSFTLNSSWVHADRWDGRSRQVLCYCCICDEACCSPSLPLLTHRLWSTDPFFFSIQEHDLYVRHNAACI